MEDVPRPHAGPGEVVIQVEAAGICGSDVKCHAGAEMFWAGPDPWVKTPVIPGHEFFGTVVEVGDGAAEAHGVVPGDLAVAEQIYPCNACRYCRRGQYWMCEVHNIYGFQREVADGASGHAHALRRQLPRAPHSGGQCPPRRACWWSRWRAPCTVSSGPTSGSTMSWCSPGRAQSGC